MKIALSISIVAVVACRAASAADWAWQPAFEWRADHQSNRLLSATRDEANQAAWLTLDAAIQRATENFEFGMHPRIALQRLANDRSLDSQDSSVQLSGRWLREYSQFAASAQFSRESTLTTELAETGIVDVNTRRELRNASASWSRYLTAQTTLDAQLGFSDVDYPDAAGLVGYRYPNASLGVTRQLSDYTSLSVTTFGSRLEAPQVLMTSRDVGLQLGMTRALSPVMKLELSAGLSETRRSNPLETRDERSQVWNVRLSRKSEFGLWNCSLERNIAPNGRGVLARRDELSAGVSRELAFHFTANLYLHAIRNTESAVRFFAADDYRYVSAEAGLDRNLTQNWILGLRVGENTAQHDIGDTNAHGWYTALTARWAPAARPIGIRD